MVLFNSNWILFSSLVNFRFSIGKCCASNGSFTIIVISAASLLLSNIKVLVFKSGSTRYQCLMSLFSNTYQNLLDSFNQCGSTVVVKTILDSFFGENRDAS